MQSEGKAPSPDARGVMDEQQLIRVYMDLTGTTEPAARNVFMMMCVPKAHSEESVLAEALLDEDGGS